MMRAFGPGKKNAGVSRKKYHFLFLVFILLPIVFSIPCTAQTVNKDNNRIMPPSPTAASLGKYGEIPVSLYTGTPNISIPIYNISVPNLSLSVNLSYNPASVRPNEIPGWVGLGWALQAGGVITRTVKDLPDDFNAVQLGTGRGFYYDLVSSNPKFNDVYNSIVSQPMTAETSLFFWENENRVNDTKPDDYSFNFGNYSGQFFFGHDGQVHIKSQQPLKITFETETGTDGATNYSSTGHFKKWTIITEVGDKYTFEKKEWSFAKLGTPGAPGEVAYVSSWYLTLIESPIWGTIQFEYTNPNGKVRAKEGRSAKMGYVIPAGSSTMDIVDFSSFGSSISFDEVIYLKKIIFNNGYLLFTTSQRNDPAYLPGGYGNMIAEEQKLDQIDLYSTASAPTRLLSWRFAYSETDRLKLLSVTKLGSSDEEGEKFEMEYDAQGFVGGTGLAFYSNPYDLSAVDHWGYYNGYESTTRIPLTPNPSSPHNYFGDAIKSSNGELASANLIKKITYPTGGYSIFTFEANDYSTVVEAELAEPNEPIHNEPTYTAYSDYYIMGPASGSYSCPGDPVSVWFILPEATSVKLLAYEKRVPNDIVPCTNEEFVTNVNQTVFLEAGSYRLDDLFGGAIASTCSSITSDPIPGNAPINCLEFIRYVVGVPVAYGQIPQTIHVTGGARIKKIETFDGVKMGVKTFSYRTSSDPNYSSGVLNKLPVYTESHFERFGLLGGFMVSSSPLKSMPTGSHIGYSEVSELREDGSKTVYFFSTYADHPDTKAFEFANHGYGPYISNDIMRGLNWRMEFYNSQGQIVKENAVEYEFGEAAYEGHILDNTIIFSVPSGGALNEGASAVSKSKISSRWLQKKKETEKLYDLQSGGFITNETEYNYSPLNFQVNEIAKANSKNEIVYTSFKYPTDLSGTVYAQLVSENRIAEVIERKSFLQTAGNELNKQQNNYEIIPNTTLIALKTTQSSQAGNSLETDVTFSEYDDHGNLLELIGRDQIKSSYVWDYSFAYPIAEVRNAAKAQIAYTSFEADGSGNWNVASIQVISTESITGQNCYQLSNGAISKDDLNSAAEYILTYWTKNQNAFTISGTQGNAIQVRSAGNWKCFMHRITGVTEISIAGTGLIDELRLHPKGAQMTTCTYEPLIGMTSQCDFSNKIVYYEYDSFGRLKLIRDHDKNILKKFDYEYQVPTHSNAVWTTTGTTRCKPCPANSNYSTNILQNEEKDTNPHSATHNQTRWTDAGSSGTCVINADWQNTATAVRCKKDGSNQNTGEQEQEQKDMNPCSSTYNETRWVVTGTNTSACPLPIVVHAKLFIVPSGINSVDIVVKFFEDAACTIPTNVTNLEVFWQEEEVDDTAGTSTFNNYSTICNGNEKVLLFGTTLFGQGPNGLIYRAYRLVAGSGYTIVD